MVRSVASTLTALQHDRQAQRPYLQQRGVKTSVTEESVKAAVVTRHVGSRQMTVYLQERHVAQAFQEALFALVPIASRPDALLSLFHANPVPTWTR